MSDITARRTQRLALDEQRRKLEAVLANIAEGVSIVDAAGRVVLVNDGFLRLYGFPAELGRPGTPLAAFVEHRLASGRRLPGEAVDSDTAELMCRRVAEVLAQGPLTFEEETPDGRTVLVRRERLPDGLLVSTYADITEGRRAEAALRESEARLAAFMEHAPVGMYLKGLDGRYAMLNPEMARVLGRPAAEMLGRDPAEVFGPDEVAMIRGFDREVVERGEPTRHEEHLPGLDAYAWSMVIRFPVKDQAGNVTHVGGFDLDITAQKRAQAELESSEQRFRAVVEDQTELICRHGPDLRLTFSNAAHARIFGKRPEDLLGQHMLEDASIPERVRPLLRDELAALTPENPIVRGENEKALLGGEVRWFEWLNRALFDGEGRLTGYQSVGRDGTERRSAEAEITRQREALHQQEKLSALGSLLAGVAHELNNPLAVVIARALMLEEDVRDPALAASVGKLRAAAERCAKIVKTFLALARQKPRERRPVAVNAVLAAALELLAYALRSGGVEVTRDLAPDLPPVSADEDQLHQVFLNLLVNAQQALRDAPAVASAPRGILVATRLEEATGYVRVEIADTGPGIPAVIRARVFDPFFTTKPVGFGTGLGLSVCHGIVTAHDGTIEAGERPGGGASVIVRLPPAAPASAVPATPEAAPTPTAPARILVVDDEPEILAIVEEILRRDGHAVELAAGGCEALRLLEARAYDLIVSDLRMPDGDGRELHRALADRHPDLARRMRFLTGDTLGAAAPSEPPGSGPDAVIEKPVEPAALRLAVRRRLVRRPPP